MLIFSRESNSTLMKITPVNSLPDFDGPSTHMTILKKIHEEAIAEKKDMSFMYIYRTVYLFFGSKGFPYYFLKFFQKFSIPGLGRWKGNRFLQPHVEKMKEEKKRHDRKVRNAIMRRYGKKVRRLQRKARKGKRKPRKTLYEFDWDLMKRVPLK